METQKHSGLGIASFITSLIAGISFFVLFAILVAMEASNPGGIDENAPETAMIGLVMIICFGISLVSLGLGIGGLMQKKDKKIFSILGTIFSTVAIICMTLIIIIGIMFG